MRPITAAAAVKRRDASPEKISKKRPRLEEDLDVEEPEQARRAASVVSEHIPGSDLLGPGGFEPEGGLEFPEQGPMEDFHLEVPEFGADVDVGGRARSKSLAPSELSRLSTPLPDVMLEEPEESYADATCPIAMFDARPSTQTSERESETQESSGRGYSKNTVKALGLVRRDLQPASDGVEKVMSFRNMAQKASRRAASSFFFELLVLGTRIASS